MYFWGFSIIISPIEKQKTEYSLTASWVCGLILSNGSRGNWHTDGVPPGAPANACWQSWTSITSFQALSTIEYYSSERIDQGVFVTMNASVNSFTTSKVAIRCWGTLWSPPTLVWGTLWSPLTLASGSICTTSESRDMLMVDFWCLSNGGAMAPTACHRFGSGVQAMSVSAQLRFYGRATCVVCIVLLRHAWSRCRSSCRMSKLSSSIGDNQVHSTGSSLSSLLISRSVWLLSCFIKFIAQTFAITNTILESWVRSSNIW